MFDTCSVTALQWDVYLIYLIFDENEKKSLVQSNAGIKKQS